MKIKRVLRLLALGFMIALACVLPVPLHLTKKDNLPKNIIERVEQAEEQEDDEEKALF